MRRHHCRQRSSSTNRRRIRLGSLATMSGRMTRTNTKRRGFPNSSPRRQRTSIRLRQIRRNKGIMKRRSFARCLAFNNTRNTDRTSNPLINIPRTTRRLRRHCRRQGDRNRRRGNLNTHSNRSSSSQPRNSFQRTIRRRRMKLARLTSGEAPPRRGNRRCPHHHPRRRPYRNFTRNSTSVMRGIIFYRIPVNIRCTNKLTRGRTICPP